jgi:hypothetical protein
VHSLLLVLPVHAELDLEQFCSWNWRHKPRTVPSLIQRSRSSRTATASSEALTFVTLSTRDAYHPTKIKATFYAVSATSLARCWHHILFFSVWATCISFINHSVKDVTIQPTLLTVYVLCRSCTWVQSSHSFSIGWALSWASLSLTAPRRALSVTTKVVDSGVRLS